MAFLDSIKAFGQDIQKTLFGTSNKSGGSSNSPFAYNPTPKVTQPAQPTLNYTPYQSSQAQAPSMKNNYGLGFQTTPKPDTSPVADSSMNQFAYNIPEPTDTGLNDYSTKMIAPKVSERDSTLSKYKDLISKIGEEGDRTKELQDEEKLAEKRQALADLTSQGVARKRQLEKEIETLRKNPQGTFGGALNQQISEKTRLANMELADIAIQVQSAQGNVEASLDIINDKITAEFQPYKDQITGIKDYMALYGDDLTKSEQILLQSNLSQQEAQLESDIKQAENQEKASVWQQAIDSGEYTIKDVPADVVPYLNPTFKGKYSQEVVEPLIDKVASISDLMSNTGISGAVGANAFARVSPLKGLSGKTTDFISKVEQLISQETLDTLINLKAKGGTLGALSQTELDILKASASTIGSRQIIKDGRVVGYDMSEESFKNELKRLETVTNRALLKADIVPVETKEEILTKEMIKKYPTDSNEKILERVQLTLPQYTSFKSAGNASASTIANAIKKVESQGNYNAKGASGEFGAYQFLASTWKQWAGEFLGNPNAKMTPQNQDFVANAKINSLIKQGYNPEQIALIWNGGTPKRKAGVNKYGVKYDSGAYADKVLSQLT